jgi:hypothetical protein
MSLPLLPSVEEITSLLKKGRQVGDDRNVNGREDSHEYSELPVNILAPLWADLRADDCFPAKNRQCDQDHSSHIETVPASSLFSPIRWKLLEIPCFDTVVNGYRTNNAENDDCNPEARSIATRAFGSEGSSEAAGGERCDPRLQDSLND